MPPDDEAIGELAEPRAGKLRGATYSSDAFEAVGHGVYDEEENKIPDVDEQLRDFYLMWTFDPVVGAVSTIIQRMLLGHIGEYADDDEAAKEWVTERLDGIEGGWDTVLQSLLSSPFVGVAVLEKQWEQAGGEWLLERLELLHPLTFAPTLGGGYMGTVQAGSGIVLDPATKRVERVVQHATDVNQEPVVLPIGNLVYWPFDRQFREDTYGRSLLKRARRSWYIKTKVQGYYNIYIEKYAVPTPLVRVPEGYWQDPNTGETMPNVEMLKEKLLDALRVGKGIVYTGDGDETNDIKADALDMHRSGTGADYAEACKYWESLTFTAMLFPQLLLMEPEHGTRAQAETMMNFFLLLLDAIRKELEEVIIQQIVKPLIYWNHGPQKDYGSWQWEELTEADEGDMAQIFAGVAAALARYVQVGYVMPEADERRLREAIPSILAPMSEVTPQSEEPAGEQAREESMLAEAAKVQRYAL